MIDPYAAMQPKALKLTAKELLSFTFSQDKAESRNGFLLRALGELCAQLPPDIRVSVDVDTIQPDLEADGDGFDDEYVSTPA